MDKFESFKKLWKKSREVVTNRLTDNDVEVDTNFCILVALNLLLEAKERSLFPQDFTED